LAESLEGFGDEVVGAVVGFALLVLELAVAGRESARAKDGEDGEDAAEEDEAQAEEGGEINCVEGDSEEGDGQAVAVCKCPRDIDSEKMPPC
jgi:hypothetical protein